MRLKFSGGQIFLSSVHDELQLEKRTNVFTFLLSKCAKRCIAPGPAEQLRGIQDVVKCFLEVDNHVTVIPIITLSSSRDVFTNLHLST